MARLHGNTGQNTGGWLVLLIVLALAALVVLDYLDIVQLGVL